MLVRARADEFGDLLSLSLAGSDVPDAAALESRLRRYAAILADEPLRVRIIADDSLRYEAAARIIGAAAAAGADAVRLSGPGEPGVAP